MSQGDNAQPGFMHRTNLQRMYDDIVKTAEIAHVSYNQEAIQRVFDVFRPYFSGSAISFVTNTRPREERHLSVRYVEIQVPHNAYDIAVEHGLVAREGHPIDNLVPDLRSKYSILGYGVDLAVDYGLAKIWQFLRALPPVEEVSATPSLPAGIGQHMAYFSEYDLRHVSLFAMDYQRKTTNIYFMVKEPGLFPPAKVAGMFEDLGFAVPSDELLQHCSRAVTIYYTFNWDSPEIERICFGTIAPQPSLIPTHLHPLLKRYVEQVPCLSKDRVFIYSVTLARNDTFIKIENDYTGSMTLLMRGGAEAVP
jgi:hypothetical protein